MLKTLSFRLLQPNLAKLQAPPSRNWGSLRTKYLRKAPIIRVDTDGTYHVEGVSNKQTPIPVLWREPTKSKWFGLNYNFPESFLNDLLLKVNLNSRFINRSHGSLSRLARIC